MDDVLRWPEIFKSLDQELKFLKPSNCELRRNLETISRNLSKVVTLAKQTDYKGVRANGYWSFVRLCVTFCNLIDQNIEDIDHQYRDFLLASRYLVALTELIIDLKDDPVLNCNPAIIPPDHVVSPTQFVALPLQHEEELAVILGKFPGFWLDASLSRLQVGVSTALSLTHLPLHRIASVFWDKNLRGLTALRVLSNGNPKGLLSTFQRIAGIAVPILKMLTYHPLLTRRDIEVFSRSSYVVDRDDNSIRKVDFRGLSAPVRCRFIQNGLYFQNKTLIFHCPGGEFVCGSADVDEVAYVQNWCSQIRNCAVISVDYGSFSSLSRILQKLLDVYFWLLDDAGADELGFSPSSIILLGESRGAGMALRLLLMLNNIKNTYGLSNDIMPSSVMSMYGVFCGFPFVSPSRVISLLDTMFFSHTLLSIEAECGGATRSLESKSATHSIASLLMWFISKEPESDKRPWYLTSLRKLKSLAQTMMERNQNPYSVPLLYDHFAQIPVPLFLISSHYCPFLDQTVALAKTWKGSVKFDVLDGLPHGFLHLGSSVPRVNEARSLCFKRLCEAVEQANLIGDE